MKKKQTLALRYAKALFALESSKEQQALLLRELHAFSSLIDSHNDLRDIFSNPVIAAPQRLAILDQLAQRVSLSTTARHFLRYLIEKKRSAILAEILDQGERLLDQASKRLHIDVSSARPLSEAYLDHLQSKLADQTHQTVVLHSTTDESLLAGLVVQIEDRVFDGSLKTRLDQMKRHLEKQIA